MASSTTSSLPPVHTQILTSCFALKRKKKDNLVLLPNAKTLVEMQTMSPGSHYVASALSSEEYR